MRKRILFVLGLLVICALVALPIRRFFAPTVNPGVTPKNFQRLYTWMPEEEVEAILGKPDTREDQTSLSSRSWEKDGCMIGIVFWRVGDFQGKSVWCAGYGYMQTSDGTNQIFNGRSGTFFDDIFRLFRF